MVYVPSARKYGFELRLNEDVLREVLNGSGTRRVLAEQQAETRSGIEAHVRATASGSAAENYIAALFEESAQSDDYGYDFDGPYGLGNRPIAVIGVPGGRGPHPDAKPPLMTEAETHALTSVRGFTIGATGEDVR